VIFTWAPTRSYKVLHDTSADWIEEKSSVKDRSQRAVVPSSDTEKTIPDTDSGSDRVLAC